MTDNRLRLIVERIERLLEERRGISEDIRDVYAEAKAVGYDAKTIRALIRRRAVSPDERAEADMLLETYEEALDMPAAQAEEALSALRPDAAALALELLTAEVVALEDPQSAAALVDHVLFLLDLRAEIALLRAQESDRKKLAKAEGFDAKQLAVTVRWFEKCAKHGTEAMRAGEATFHLYRATFDARPSGEPVSTDNKLQQLFAPPKPDAKARRRSTARELAALARRASEGGPA